jgi:hypothetical protein
LAPGNIADIAMFVTVVKAGSLTDDGEASAIFLEPSQQDDPRRSRDRPRNRARFHHMRRFGDH